jgi:UDP-hydrolysing UDP-N-acetyl-D-glucosamine 2-epimerase
MTSGPRRRICVVVTARPSYSRIKTALQAIAEHPALELQLVVAASALLDRYGTVTRQIETDGFSIDARVQVLVEGEDPVAMAKTTGLATIELASALQRLRPDAVVTIADRYETLATATAAAYLGIPLVHVQGGEVTGSIDDRVRHAVTKLADIHLPSNAEAAARIVRMGEASERIVVTGCPSIDLAAALPASDRLPFDPHEVYGGVGPDLDLSEGYLVVMQHPVTGEHTDARAHVTATIEAVVASGLPALWFWPNPDAGADGTSDGIRAFREQHEDAPLQFFKNMSPDDFLQLLVHSRALVGNSSVGLRECAYLGVPVVNIGSRQDGRERGRNVIDVAHEPDAILAAIRTHLGRPRPGRDVLYGDGGAGRRIADTLATIALDTSKRPTY